MASVNRKQQYSYRLSYAEDVGSSFDPDMEDVADWESDLKGTCAGVYPFDTALSH